MKKYLLLLLAGQLAACVHTDQTWVRDYDGNQLEVKTSHKGDDGVKKYVIVTNTNRTWEGKYKGGEPMVQLRKDLLLNIGHDEAATVCKPANYLQDGDADYSMLDRSPGIFGGGLIGYALAAGLSDYDNLPTAMSFSFSCTNNPIAPTKASLTQADKPLPQNPPAGVDPNKAVPEPQIKGDFPHGKN